MRAWFGACSVAVAVAGGAPQAVAQSILSEAWKLDGESDRVALTLYQPNYLLLARWSDAVNQAPYSPRHAAPPLSDDPLDDVEAKFQLSFKARVAAGDGRRWGLWLAYTQQSHWQLYNSTHSRPFRETDYMPEVILMHDPQMSFAGVDWRLASIGFAHQSNGRAEPLSRSWNRVMLQLGFERGDFAVVLRPWLRLEEDASVDDNADIEDYLGHGDINLTYRWGEQRFNLMGRANVRTGKGALELSWMSGRFAGALRGYVQLFSGYGESLIDYNWRQTTFGFGIAIRDSR